MDVAHQLILIGGGLGLLSIFVSLLSGRLGTPLLLVFLAIGMLAGREGPLGIVFNDTRAAYLIGSGALSIILFEGGLKTRREHLRLAVWPALTLATAGVVITAGIVAATFMVLMSAMPPQQNWTYPVWTLAVLVGASIAPTDAAAVSMLLTRSRVLIPPRLSALLEIESGLNDPVSVFLVAAVTNYLVVPASAGFAQMALLLASEMVGGTVLGLAGGRLLLWAVMRVQTEVALCPIVALMGLLMLFGAAQSLGASGFLALYLAGIVVGQGTRRAGIVLEDFFVVFGWMAQLVLFLMLGLLVVPHELLKVGMLASVLCVVAGLLAGRFASCLVCLLPFRFRFLEVSFASWVGLRGAVPIYLTIIPALEGVKGAEFLFAPTFVVVITSLIVQGWTIGPMAQVLGFPRVSRATPRQFW